MDNKWLLLGGGVAAAVVLFIVMKSSSSSQTSQIASNTTSGVTSNTGTPDANNNSLLGFTDPATGINWILNASDQWVGQLPAGALPPNYTPGAATVNPFFVPTTNTVTGV